MARDFKVDDYGDFVIEDGDFVIVEGAEELRQRLQTKILKILDEDVYDQDGGVDWFGVMYNFQATRDQVLLQIRRTVVSAPEVTGIQRLDMVKTDGGNIQIELTIDSEFGELSLVNS